MPNKKTATYHVKGMHCAACEALIENKISKLKGVTNVKAATHKNCVTIEYKEETPELKHLNNIFHEAGYNFSSQPAAGSASQAMKGKNFLMALGLGILAVIAFLLITKSGLTSLVNVNSKSSLPMFILFGLLAGFSSCAALVGGIVLSLSKQWSELPGAKDSFAERAKPHLLFNLGRLASFAVLGGLLGAIGSALKLSASAYSVIIFAVSVMMLVWGLQMLGVKFLQRFQIRLPKLITNKVTDEKNFKSRTMPLIIGALTFLLPCGFTITAQGLALLSGNMLQGALIMLFFALGTLPGLLAIGLISLKLYSQAKWSNIFVKVAGVIILFFALYNINAQLNVLGVFSLNDIQAKTSASTSNTAAEENGFPPVVNGQQVIKMQASASGYSPNAFKVKAGVPVRWEITDVGTSGCTSAVISHSLFDGEIKLTPGQTSTKEFTAAQPGTYKFSCWMGMVTGTIEVVADTSQAKNSESSTASTFESGASSSGCGCSGH
ncbi:MAG: sulfite exporter TauE/SafE family protein [Patescibacteria group bacterium]|jgi:sulfite exporter TauE/SafE/copper chaperone CopZ